MPDPWGVASVADAPAVDPWGVASVDDAAPAPLSGPIGAAPVPAGLRGAPAPVPQLGSSLGDVASTIGSHAFNAVAGPVDTVAAPPQGTAEKVANMAMPGGLALYRAAVKPSLAPARQAFQQAGQGNFSGAARSAESAIPVVGPWADQVESDVANKGAVAGLAGLATDVLAPKAAAKVAGALPAAMNSSARGMINTTIGARKADFARGANPGQGYLENGIGPSASMQSIADKSGDALDLVGQQLGDAYTQASQNGVLIPSSAVRSAVHPLLDSAKKGASAPLVVADPAVYDQMKASLEPALQAADAKGGFTPKELFDIRHDLNKSLNWGDQSKRNLTQTQQQISGALGGLLEDNVPGVEDLNQKYQDLVKLHDRASERAKTGSQSLTGMAAKAATSAAGSLLAHGTPLTAAGGMVAGAALSSVPARTTMAAGLSRAGKMLAPAGKLATAAAVPATLAAVSGNNVPAGPDNAPDQGTNKELTQGTPTADSLSPAFHPDTHTFSTTEWLKGNPGADPDEAREHAASLGFTVTD